MNKTRIVALVLIGLGVLALVYGGFTYTKERHDAQLGPLEIEFAEKERVNIPAWAGAAAVLLGSAMLAFGRPRVGS